MPLVVSSTSVQAATNQTVLFRPSLKMAEIRIRAMLGAEVYVQRTRLSDVLSDHIRKRGCVYFFIKVGEL